MCLDDDDARVTVRARAPRVDDDDDDDAWVRAIGVTASDARDMIDWIRGGALAQDAPKLLQFRLHLHLAGAKCPIPE